MLPACRTEQDYFAAESSDYLKYKTKTSMHPVKLVKIELLGLENRLRRLLDPMDMIIKYLVDRYVE